MVWSTLVEKICAMSISIVRMRFYETICLNLGTNLDVRYLSYGFKHEEGLGWRSKKR